jgi:hypothetical protein
MSVMRFLRGINDEAPKKGMNIIKDLRQRADFGLYFCGFAGVSLAASATKVGTRTRITAADIADHDDTQASDDVN